MSRIAFLIGGLIVPALLLWLGHRLRDRSAVQRGAFWGGVIGHSGAILVALAVLHYPPVMWTGELRAAIAMWVMLLGAAAGAGAGALRGRSG